MMFLLLLAFLLHLLLPGVVGMIMVVGDKDGQEMRFVDTDADPWYVTTPSTTPQALKIAKPIGVALTPDGKRVIIADLSQCQLKMVDLTASPYVISVIAGTGTCPPGTPDQQIDAVGTAATLNQPFGVAVSSDGSFALWTEYKGKWVRRIDLRTLAIKSIEIAGTQKDMNSAYGITISPDDTFALIGDTENHVVRRLDLQTLAYTVVAGKVGNSGEDDGDVPVSRLNFPSGVAVSPDATYAIIADRKNKKIRKLVWDVASGVHTLSTLIANTGKEPRFVAFDATAANIYFSMDAGSLNTAKADGTAVWTRAGSTTAKGAVDGQGTDARFNLPMGIAAKHPYAAPDHAFTISTVVGCGTVAGLWEAGTAGCAVEGGTTLTMTGVGFEAAGVTNLAVAFNGAPCTLVVATVDGDTCGVAPSSAKYSMKCRLPCASSLMWGQTYVPVATRTRNGATETAAVLWAASITYAAGINAAATFACFISPTITTVSPLNVFSGTAITVSGTNFGPEDRGTLTMSVTIGGVDCTAGVIVGSWTASSFSLANCATSGTALPIIVSVGSLVSAPSVDKLAVVDLAVLVPITTSVTALDAAALTVTVGWAEPTVIPGTLSKYVIEHSVNPNFLPIESVIALDAAAGDFPSKVLTGFALGSLHYVRVGAAHSHAPSAPIFAPPHVFRIAAAPSAPKVLGVTVSSVLATATTMTAIVRWQLGTMNGCIPNGATIRWREAGVDVGSAFIKIDSADTSSATERLVTATGLTVGKTYAFSAKMQGTMETGAVAATVISDLDSGWGADATHGASLALVPLAAPSALMSTVTDVFGVWYNASVTWTGPLASVAEVTSYQAYHRIGATGPWIARTCSLTDPEALLACGIYGTLPATAMVCFKVSAVYLTGESVKTESSCILPFYIAPTGSPVKNYVPPTPAPSALTPDSLTAYFVGRTGATYAGHFVWIAQDGATAYDVVVTTTAEDGSLTSQTVKVSGASVGFTGSIVHPFSSVPLTSKVCATVQSDSLGGQGAVSPKACLETNVPATPTQLDGTFENSVNILGIISGVKLTMTWSAPDQSSSLGVARAAVTHYLVEYEASPSLALVQTVTTSREPTFVVNFPTLESNVEFRVAAVSAFGDSLFSAKKVVAVGPPLAPTQLAGVFDEPADGKVKVTIRWAAPDQSPAPNLARSAVTSYKIEYEGISTITTGSNAVPSVPLVLIETVDAASTYIITFDVLNNNVEFRVAAVSALGTSPFSEKKFMKWPFASVLKSRCAALGQYIPPGKADCYKCPAVGVSCTAGVLVVQPGYWFKTGSGVLIDDKSQVYMCLSRKACVPDTMGNADVVCASGYEGVACSTCSSDYVRSGRQCRPKFNGGIGLMIFAAELCGAVAIVLVLMCAHSNAVPALRIVLDFVQVVCIMLSASTFRNLVAGTTVAETVNVAFSGALASSVGLGSLFPVVASSIHVRQYTSFVFLWGSLFVILLLALQHACHRATYNHLCAFREALGAHLAHEEQLAIEEEAKEAEDRAIGRYEPEGEDEQAGLDGMGDSSEEEEAAEGENDGMDDEVVEDPSFMYRAMHNLLKMAVPLIYFAYSDIAHSSLAVLVVTEYGGVDVMQYSPGEEASTPMHIVSMVISAIMIAVYGFAIPITVLIVVLHGLTESPPFSSRCSNGCAFIHIGHHATTRWWQLWLISRRVLLTLIVVVVEEAPISQVIACCTLCVVSLAAHALLKPYETQLANALALLCEGASLFVPIVGLIFWSRDVGAQTLLPMPSAEFDLDVTTWIVAVVATVAAVVIVIACIRCVLSYKSVHRGWISTQTYVLGLVHQHVVRPFDNASVQSVHGEEAAAAAVASSVELVAPSSEFGSSHNPLFAARAASRAAKEGSGRQHLEEKEQSQSESPRDAGYRGHGGGGHHHHQHREAAAAAAQYSSSDESIDLLDESSEEVWQQPEQVQPGRTLTVTTYAGATQDDDSDVLSPHYFPQNVTPTFVPHDAAPPLFVQPEEILHPSTVRRRRNSIAEFEAAFAEMAEGDGTIDA